MERVPDYLRTAINVLVWLLAALRAILELVDCDVRTEDDRTPLPHSPIGVEELPF